jgi:hypothetical protein
MWVAELKIRTDIQIVLSRSSRYRLVAAAALVLTFCIVSCGSSSTASSAAPPNKLTDIRGSWDEVSSVGTAQYPQTLTISSEDFSTGALQGTDFGDQKTFSVVGSISGTDVTFTTTAGAYIAHSKGKVSLSGGSLMMSGTFTDSNNSVGTFTAKRTAPAPSSSP